jgi:hypothetical protein
MKIIGLGKAGCSIAKTFSKFPQYNVIKIDADGEPDIIIDRQLDHEGYEAHFPDIQNKLLPQGEDTLVIVCGAGRISGGILRLLEQLKEDRVTVLYIQPDLELASEVQKKQEKIVRHVLQEYSRSGMIESVWMIDNQMVEKGIGEVPIMGYYDVLNQAIVNTLHMINIFRNSEPVIGSFVIPSVLSRIVTIGILDMETKEEKWFFSLTNPRDVVYYYGINEEDLKNDGSLFKKITNFVKSKVVNGLNISYGVYKTSYEQKYCYCIKYSSVVQYKLGDQELG